MHNGEELFTNSQEYKHKELGNTRFYLMVGGGDGESVERPPLLGC